MNNVITAKLPIGLQIISTISIVWAVLLFISSIGMVIPMFLTKQIHLLPIVQLLMSIAYYVIGKNIRLKNIKAGILNLVLSVPVVWGLIYFRYGVAPIGITLCIIMNLLVVVNWKHFNVSKQATEQEIS